MGNAIKWGQWFSRKASREPTKDGFDFYPGPKNMVPLIIEPVKNFSAPLAFPCPTGILKWSEATVQKIGK